MVLFLPLFLKGQRLEKWTKNRYNTDETDVLVCPGLSEPDDIPEREALWNE
jgi:hypothetical protein